MCVCVCVFSSEARPKAKQNSELGWQEKKNEPDRTIHFLVEVFAFLSLFQPPKTFFSFYDNAGEIKLFEAFLFDSFLAKNGLK